MKGLSTVITRFTVFYTIRNKPFMPDTQKALLTNREPSFAFAHKVSICTVFPHHPARSSVQGRGNQSSTQLPVSQVRSSQARPRSMTHVGGGVGSRIKRQCPCSAKRQDLSWTCLCQTGWSGGREDGHASLGIARGKAQWGKNSVSLGKDAPGISGKGLGDHLVGLECQAKATPHYTKRQWEANGGSEKPMTR